MNPLGSADTLYLVLGFVVPGLVIVFVRSQFITGRTLKHADAILSYITISSIYYAAIFPVILFILSISSAWLAYISWVIVIFIAPVALGMAAGLSAKNNLVRRLMTRLGMNPVHVMPTAWDWKFSSISNQWVLVVLKDGKKFAGFCGGDSFFSSDPGERDIYIQWVYDIDDENQWISAGEKSVLIAAGEIRTVEFWPYYAQGAEE